MFAAVLPVFPVPVVPVPVDPAEVDKLKLADAVPVFPL